jgi:hypothetical protein
VANNTKIKAMIDQAYQMGVQRGMSAQPAQQQGYIPTRDEQEFPSYFLSQRNQKRQNGEGKFWAYEQLWGKPKNNTTKVNRSASSILFGR